MAITKKNHYNPCFWTAYWNFKYLDFKKANPNQTKPVREIELFALNLSSNKILLTKTENIFFEKKAGIASIMLNDGGEGTFDFENHFTIMEDCYRKSLENLILYTNKVDDEEKARLTSFIVFQILRHPSMLNPMEILFRNCGMTKSEMLISLKQKLSSVTETIKLSIPFLLPKWTIYKVSKNIFPLSDNPMLFENGTLMFAISPDILIEMNLNEKGTKIQGCRIKTKISYLKYRKFINRTIRSATREIVFGNTELLEKVRKSSEYKKHLKKINVC